MAASARPGIAGRLTAATEALASSPPATRTARRWRSADLFGAEQEIEIEHGRAIYRLRRTALGKLILTK